MNSLSGIRAINNGNKPVAADRYQVQYKGNQWCVFDAWTNGWGKQDSEHAIIADRVAELNEEQRKINREKAQAKADADDRAWIASHGTARIPSSNPAVAQAQDLNDSLHKA